jgi:hypothetical protein
MVEEPAVGLGEAVRVGQRPRESEGNAAIAVRHGSIVLDSVKASTRREGVKSVKLGVPDLNHAEARMVMSLRRKTL